MSSWVATLTPSRGEGCNTVVLCGVLAFGWAVCHCAHSRSMFA